MPPAVATAAASGTAAALSFALPLALISLCQVSVVECDTANLAWRVAIVKFALEVKSVHRLVAL